MKAYEIETVGTFYDADLIKVENEDGEWVVFAVEDNEIAETHEVSERLSRDERKEMERHLEAYLNDEEIEEDDWLEQFEGEEFWSFCKRRLAKFNGISKEYFDYHLKETEWRWMRGPNELATELWNLIR